MRLAERHGWAEMGRRIPIRCFLHNPSVKSSLTFLRKTPWARQKAEAWFIAERGKGHAGIDVGRVKISEAIRKLKLI
jgi:uncharacterized protein (DUF2132 family)